MEKESGVEMSHECLEESNPFPLKYDVSVLILTYHPNLKKLLTTIISCLIQKGIKLQIVISDDGSEHFEKAVIEEFFGRENFSDYAICINEKNEGTVLNVQKGLERCEGEYVKLISPGDYLYGDTVLCTWISVMRSKQAALSFSNAIYYQDEGDGISPVKAYAHPQQIQQGDLISWRYSYLIFDDLVLGAAVLSRKDVLERYIAVIAGKVRYVEDDSYRLMAYQEETMFFFNQNTILYEYGIGISTSGNSIWNARIQKDWEETNKILMKWISEGDGQKDKVTENLKRIIYCGEHNTFGNKVLKWLTVKGYLRYQIRRIFRTRMTETALNSGYLEMLGLEGKRGTANAGS